LNVDLIAGLPGQTQASWRESIEWAGRLDVPHVSVYMLEIDGDSRLGREILKGGMRYGAADAPSEDATAELYEIAVEYFGGMGLSRYEISNFARPGMESRHNLKYWHLESYAGFGSDAHSFDGVLRGQNAETPGDYVARHKNGEPVRVESSAARLDEERFFVGLRLTEGIRPSPEGWDKHGDRIRRLIHAGLLRSDGDKLQLTSRGVLLSNEVFQEFIGE
jgi:oxygen-independent coproporphyrinogen-3 oxidase